MPPHRHRRRLLLLLLLHHDALGREHQRGDGRGILQRGRVTLVGSMTPARPDPRTRRSGRCSRSSCPSTPSPSRHDRGFRAAFWTIIRIGSSSERRTISTPIFWSSSLLSPSRATSDTTGGHAASGHDASSTAARVACSASSTLPSSPSSRLGRRSDVDHGDAAPRASRAAPAASPCRSPRWTSRSRP